MKSLQKIVLAIDLDQPSPEAWQTCERLASRFASEVVPVHVVDQRLRPVPDAWRERVRAAATERLRPSVEEMRQRGLQVAPPIIDFGNPYEQIIGQAEMLGANVIVAGAGERSAGGGIGPTAEQLVRRSAKPVWVARPGSPTEAGTILCALDFSEPSVRALRNAVHLARSFGARLTLVHVLEAASSWFAGMIDGKDHAVAADHARTRIDEMLRPLDHHGVPIRTLVVSGKPAETIVSVAGEEAADLLVMGSAGRTGLDRLFLGSVATRVLRHLPCSMITVKGEHIVRPEFDARVIDFDQHFKRGIELGRGGFAAEALEEFRRCLDESPMSPHVWLAMAGVHDKTGNEAAARSCRQRAESISRTIEDQRIEAAIRRDHWLMGVKR
jgi:nucleotide-binding universal stress UspA family protein